MNNCPHCNSYLVLPYKGKNDILLAGDFPSDEDMKRGVPFSGDSGEVLRYELSMVGIDMWQCSLTNLWLHYQNKNPDCFEMGLKVLTLEMAGRKVLLMGKELCNFFVGGSVTDYAGLEVKSPLFPNSVQFVMIAPNPGICLHTTLGEFRLAIQKFSRRCNE